MPRLTRFLLLALLVAISIMPSGCKKAGLRGSCVVILAVSGCTEIVSYSINGQSRMRFVDSLFLSRHILNLSEPWAYNNENCNNAGMGVRLRYRYYQPFPNYINDDRITWDSKANLFDGLFSQLNLYPKISMSVRDSLPPSLNWDYTYQSNSYQLTQVDSIGNRYTLKVAILTKNENVPNCFN